ncbi:MAG: hypothetical protein CBR30_06465 [Dictyoglomus sp. NZ13-RE01]|nr:MAG: hypothetical protein CBR30_06465 [Dictyoglomus sp. NZ13-RE01]
MKGGICMKGLKILISLILISTLIFSLTYAYSGYRIKEREKVIIGPVLKTPLRIQVIERDRFRFREEFSEELRKMIAERNKLWLELRELLMQKPVDLNKVNEYAEKIQKLEQDIQNKAKEETLSILSKRLSLSKDQENSIRAIWDKYGKNLEELRKDLRKKNLELRATSKEDTQKINSLKKEILDLQKKISETRKNLINEIRNVLTKEQRAKFDKYFFEIRGWLWIKR